MYVPGTGDVNPEKVNSYAWQVPTGWTVNGQLSTGTNWLVTGQNVTVTYPASNTRGSIKVKASYLVSCGGLQESKESTAVTVSRSVSFTINTDQSYKLCNDISPVTFSVSPALPCALYYWNNSQTPTTNNSFQITPDGHSNIVATVNIVYGTSNTNLSKTLQYQLFAPGVVPLITGSSKVCNGVTQTYSVSNLRPGYTVNWNSNTPNLTLMAQTATTADFKSNGNGTGSIHAVVVSDCGTHTVNPDFSVWVGAPSFQGGQVPPVTISGPTQLTPGYYATYSLPSA